MLINPRDRLLGDGVYDAVYEYLLKASPTPGARLKDAEVSERLGVSRTPVREALLRLEREGLIDHHARRGFRVRSLTMEEAEQTYQVLWTLEGFALRSSPTLSPEAAETLTSIADAVHNASNAELRIELDNKWHATLLHTCANTKLLQMIRDLKQVVSRYEFRYMAETDLVAKSRADHLSIIAAARRNTNGAAVLLERHWSEALEALRRMISANEQPSIR